MREIIHVCELMVYLGLCLFVGLGGLVFLVFNGGIAAVVESTDTVILCFLGPIGFYLSYLLALNAWEALGSVGAVLLVLVTAGGILIIIVPGEYIRRVAYKYLYMGPAPVPVIYGNALPPKKGHR